MRDGSDFKGAWAISQPREVGLVRLYLVLLAGKGVATGPFVDQYRSSPSRIRRPYLNVHGLVPV